ncbi:MAG: hypothetical protein R2741_15885 [Methanolobus sp.]
MDEFMQAAIEEAKKDLKKVEYPSVQSLLKTEKLSGEDTTGEFSTMTRWHMPK